MDCVRCHKEMNTTIACEHCGMLYKVYRSNTVAIDPISAFIKEDNWGKEVISDEEYYTNLKVDNTKAKIEGMVINFDIYTEDEVELQLGDYEIEVRDGKTYAVKKKPIYPKDYEECCKMLNTYCTMPSRPGYKNDLIAKFQELLICRDAYWKIAGEEMGLDKPWKPEYISLEDNTYFTIQTFNGGIDKSAISHRNTILAFPTIEMRDAFYENFKELIEQCKELL